MPQLAIRVAVAALLLAACPIVVVADDAAVAAAPTTAPADLDSLGRSLAVSANARDGAAILRHFDLDALVARTLRGVEPGLARTFDADLRVGLRRSVPMLIDSQAQGTRFVFLRQHDVDGERRLAVRALGPDGLNYFDFLAVPADADHAAPRLIDLHAATTGEPISRTMQRLLLRASPGGKPPTPEMVKHMADFKEFVKAAREGDARDALQRFDAMPEVFRKDKSVHVVRMVAASRLQDEAAIHAAADEFKKLFGDDPACDLILLDSHFARGQTAEALACVDRLDQSIGGDPYLDVLRANLIAAAKDLPAARRHAARAVEREPTLFEAVDAALTFALQAGDFADAKRWMLMMERTPAFAFRFDDELGGAELFAPFRASPQFAAWQKERPKAE